MKRRKRGSDANKLSVRLQNCRVNGRRSLQTDLEIISKKEQKMWITILLIIIIVLVVLLSIPRSQSETNVWSNESWDEVRSERRRTSERNAAIQDAYTVRDDANVRRLKSSWENRPVLNMGSSSPRLTHRTAANKTSIPMAASGKTRQQIEGETERFWSDPDAARKHLAKYYHPDRNPPEQRDLCNEIMKDINAEYERRKGKR
jgi:hypothetical protein